MELCRQSWMRPFAVIQYACVFVVFWHIRWDCPDRYLPSLHLPSLAQFPTIIARCLEVIRYLAKCKYLDPPGRWDSR